MKILETRQQLAPLQGKEHRMYLGSFWLFIIAEGMIFVALFMTRFVLSQFGHPTASIDYWLESIITALFVLSIWPMRMAVISMGRGDTQAMGRWLFGPIACGLLALAGIFFDWATIGISAGSRFGENYLVTEGYHTIHIGIGILALAGLWASRWRFTAQNYWAVEAVERFWYFVVAAWILIFVIFFIV